MTSQLITPRQARLRDLYALRQRVQDEITILEAAMPTGTRRRAAECGTDGGYHHHRKITKTPPCQPCKDAHAQVEAVRAARRRLAAAQERKAS